MLSLSGRFRVQFLLHLADTILGYRSTIGSDEAGEHSATKVGEGVICFGHLIDLLQQGTILEPRTQAMVADEPKYSLR